MLTKLPVSDDPIPPPWSSSDEVEAAVRALAASSKRTHQAAYHRVLFSIGNSHARTYWPAALSLIARLEELLSEGGEAPRLRALHVLASLVWFEPEPGFELVDTPDGPRHLTRLVWAAIARLERAVQRIESSTSSPREQRLAVELLSYIAEPPPDPLES